MRLISKLAGLAIAVTACGGGDKSADQQTTTMADQQATSAGSADSAAPAGGAAAPAAGTGATHDVKMVMEGTTYKFDPATITIKAGDVIKFHNVSGGPHNVSFWGDSIPKGAAAPLKAGMPEQIAELEGPLLTEPNAAYTVTFANVPKGQYKFYCLPHLALGMKGQITVQ